MTIPGSEFFWNPKAKLRTRKVQSVVDQMRERRQERYQEDSDITSEVTSEYSKVTTSKAGSQKKVAIGIE